MPKAIIIYGSTTGNTEIAAEMIDDYLKESNYLTLTYNVTDVSPDILNDKFDRYLLGCSTWGEDEIELQEDFEIFYENLSGDLSLQGKQFAVFGCGDSSYTYFCGAVDAIEDRINRLGGIIICDSLRIDGDPEKDKITEWTKEMINA